MHKLMNANYGGDLGSFGKAEYRLMRQYKFPSEFDQHKDKFTTADHDRCLMWDHNHATRVIREHTGGGDQRIGQWAQTASEKAIFDFLIAILKTDEKDWTGFRIMGTVNRSNGYVVWSLQLFKNGSGVAEYSGDTAPNVNRLKWHENTYSTPYDMP